MPQKYDCECGWYGDVYDLILEVDCPICGKVARKVDKLTAFERAIKKIATGHPHPRSYAKHILRKYQ
jgi:hypothetical protein